MEEPTNTDQEEIVKCPKCPRVFSNMMGLRMHNIRKHTNRNWDTGGNFKSKKRAKMKERRIQIIYPDPREPTPMEVTRTIRFCPHCGENIEKHL